ncbi:MAG: DUF2520 domain-containing protein [Chitinophagaceae bacterium]|nr:DUF2520 domain-containing protein [Chitinophagaceae bacterium]
MEIVIIGTGNAATILGRKLKQAGHDIIQIFGRNAEAASKLAYELDTQSTVYWSIVTRDADIYILAVSDIAIDEVLQELQFPKKTVVHTAASVTKDILKKSAEHYGVFYPLQTLKKDSAHLPDTPIIIDASDEETLLELEHLALSISDKVVQADDQTRLKLHIAAVFCNNFVNHIFSLMEEYCKKEGIDFQLLIPLIKETVLNINGLSPSKAQTGPAIRNDQKTIKRHLELLNDHPHLKKMYELFTDSILRHR